MESDGMKKNRNAAPMEGVDAHSILKRNNIFFNRHVTERCFILCTGPSINTQNLRVLKNEICIGVSMFYRHSDFSIIRPDYYCYAPYHPPCTEERWDSVMETLYRETGDATMFFALSDFHRNRRKGGGEGRELHFLDYSGSWQDALAQGIDLTRPVPEIQSGSIIPLMIALYMGFKKIYLLGCDLSWILRYFNQTEHFHDTRPPDIQGAGFHQDYYESVEYEFLCNFKLMQQFRALGEIAGKQSIEIYNATPGGLLDVFPRAELETLFPGCHGTGTRVVPPFLENDRIDAEPDLSNIRTMAESNRFGRWCVHYQGLLIHCHDLLSFYMAAKDIFINRIYDFTAERNDPLVIDGGGHIGLFTLYIKKKYPWARVVAFEPEAESHGLFQKNLQANAIDGVELIKAGLYKEETDIPFQADHSDGGSIFGQDTNMSIHVIRLSAYLKDRIDFLKLNIEGAELDVLTETFSRLKHVMEMVIEYHGFPEIGQKLHDILSLLHRSGFRYLIHDFDHITNSVTKPPFKLGPGTRIFQLIYAKRMYVRHDSKSPVQIPGNGDPAAEPVSRLFGFDRGLPIDRFFIEKFMDKNRSKVTGHVLEMGDKTYTLKYGSGVVRSDVLNVTQTPDTTILGNLSTGRNIPEEQFDCIIMTQTLQMIYDMKSALKNIYKALKKGGVLLLTASGISQISRYDMDRWGEYWRFTDKSLKMLLSEYFAEEDICVESHGNAGIAKSFLDGLAVHEIPAQLFEHDDPDYQVVLTAVAQKTRTGSGKPKQAPKAENHLFGHPLILLYHRVAEDPINAQLLAVSPANFKKHLAILKETCRTIPLYRLVEEARSGILKPDTVAITFDDGYLDNLVNAVPFLEEYGLHATIFVTSGRVGKDREFWWDAMERIFMDTRHLPDDLKLGLGPRTFQWGLLSAQERLKAHDELCELLRVMPPRDIDRLMDDLLQWAGLPKTGLESHKILNTEQIRTLSGSSSIEIGSHTMTHGRLSSLDKKAQQQEIEHSRKQLESLTGKTIRFISYPFGSIADFTDETQALVKAAGYEAGIANIQRNVTKPVNFFAMPRRLVRNWTDKAFSGWLRSGDKNTLEKETMAVRCNNLKDILRRFE